MYQRRLVKGWAVISTLALVWGPTLTGLGTMVQAKPQASPGWRFEVASVKPNMSGPPTVGPNGLLTTPFRLAPGGLFTGTNVTLVEVLSFLDIKTNQVQGGPAWIYSKRFDIIARADPAAGEVKGWTDGGQEQWKQMIRGLLEDRFKLKMHRETKDVPGLVLVAGKDSLKLQEYKSGPRGALQPGPSREMTFRGVPVSALAGYLSSILRTPVVDHTGVSGLFDFTLAPYQFAPAPIDGAPDSALTFADLVRTAVEQLGLRLENAKVPMEMAIIDQAETPSEN
jgi:uncharacterized protein (TIGR03435 family)